MFSPFIRLILLILCAAVSVVGAILNIWPIFIFTFLASIGILWGYYKVGTVPLALIRLRKNEFEAVGRLITQIQRPEILTKKNKAYFYFINGMLTHEEEKFEQSRDFLEEALSVGKLREPDQAMAYLALTDMEMVQHHENKAKEYFRKLKGMKVYPGMMEDVQKVKDWLGE